MKKWKQIAACLLACSLATPVFAQQGAMEHKRSDGYV